MTRLTQLLLALLAAGLFFGTSFPALGQPGPGEATREEPSGTSDTARVRVLLAKARAVLPASPRQAQHYARQALTLAKGMEPHQQLLPDVYNHLGRALQAQRELPEAQRYFTLARDLSARLDLPRPLAESYRQLGVMESQQNRPLAALHLFKLALATQLRLEVNPLTLRDYSNLGFIYQQQGQYALALRAYLKGLKIGEQHPESAYALHYVNLLSNISALYGIQGNNAKAVGYAQRALAVLRRFPNPKAELTAWTALGAFYANTNQDSLARQCLTKGIEIAQRLGKAAPPRDVAACYYYLAGLANWRQEYPAALGYLRQAATQAQRAGQADLLVTVLNETADVYRKQQRYQPAYAAARQALGAALGAGYVKQAGDSYRELAEISAEAGNYAAAFRYQQRYHALKDSLFNAAKSRELANLATQYEVKRKEAQISLLQRNMALQQRARNLLVGSLLVVACMGGASYRRYRLERKARRQLQVKELELAARNQVLTHTEQRLHQSLDEKEVLLKEVHHRVKNNLQVIASRLALQALAQRANPTVMAALRDGQNWVKSIALIHEMLYQSDDLASVAFQPFLEQLVAQLSRAFAGAGAGEVVCAVHAPGIHFGTDTAVPVALVVNELVSNAYKHAFVGGRNGRVDISLRVGTSGEYCLRVRDNGAGLPPGFSLDTTSSLGLRLARSLARQLEGSLAVGPPASGPGTEFCLTFRAGPEPACQVA